MALPLSSEFVALQTALAGRYSLEREVGRGGMGIVFLAHEVALDRPVALKLLPPELAAQPEVRGRFLQEARTAAKLSHPHIVPIYSVDEVDEWVFYTMALVDGQSLGERVRTRGPLSDADATRLMREVAWALAYAHLQGVVHRDVKPDNILIERGTGRAMVLDFGIAQVGPADEPSRPDRVQGTAEFMSPEQAKGAAVDSRSDLYSLGAVGFYATSGRVPFEEESASLVLARHVTEAAPPIASRAPGVSSALAGVIDRCLRKDPEDRPADGGAIAEALAEDTRDDRPLPVPLRVFIKRMREMTQSSSALVAFLIVFVVPSLVGVMVEGPRGPAAALLVGLVTLVTAALGGNLTHQARKVLKAGHAADDVRLALRQDVARRNEEFRFEVGERSTLLDRIATKVAFGSLLSAVGLLGGYAALGSAAPEALLQVGSTFLVAGLGAGFLRSVRARRRADVSGERWLKVLSGRVGDWIFKLAGVGLEAPAATGLGSYRPTEMAIGLAASRLFEDLPRETRRELADLPGAIERLEADARALRTHLKELNGVLAEIGEGPRGRPSEEGAELRADVEKARGDVEARLREAVTALETIRMGLLRMHAGERIVQSVTMDLEAARGLSHDMEHLLEGHREVERLLARRRATRTLRTQRE